MLLLVGLSLAVISVPFSVATCGISVSRNISVSNSPHLELTTTSYLIDSRFCDDLSAVDYCHSYCFRRTVLPKTNISSLQRFKPTGPSCSAAAQGITGVARMLAFIVALSWRWTLTGIKPGDGRWHEGIQRYVGMGFLNSVSFQY